METLRMPPSSGTNALTNEEREWCEQTVRFFRETGQSSAKAPPRRERAAVRRGVGNTVVIARKDAEPRRAARQRNLQEPTSAPATPVTK